MSGSTQGARIPREVPPLSRYRAACIVAIASELYDVSKVKCTTAELAEDFARRALATDLQNDPDVLWRATAQAICRCLKQTGPVPIWTHRKQEHENVLPNPVASQATYSKEQKHG